MLFIVFVVAEIHGRMQCGGGMNSKGGEKVLLCVLMDLCVCVCMIGDTASSLGSAVDELMRHQPSLRSEATKAIIKVIKIIEKRRKLRSA